LSRGPLFLLALARPCARRLRHSNAQGYKPKRAHIFAVVPNSIEVDVADFATRLVDELGKTGRTELVWDARATTHTATWFNRIEEVNDYVVYVANWAASGWTRQCCRQADAVLMVAPAGGRISAWPAGIAESAVARGARVELALLHPGKIEPGAAAAWLKTLPTTTPAPTLHHHIVEPSDYGPAGAPADAPGVGLVLSGGGARGFAHWGLIRALRSRGRCPSIFWAAPARRHHRRRRRWGGAIRKCGSVHRQRLRRHESVNDYTFPPRLTRLSALGAYGGC
jgi:hypothetical protein